ncbi:epothilone polyketide synthase D [Nocardia kruczakiae]|uniref:Epothilone polyketide synthase D n=1 Tax=Nocardia kruczakiae TaxID=261477 RepID=A0ABU1XGT1_9NOCA|nr:type I polyketide synthase [Nocardia kruczakiae]MDR7169760.1 epothilone polyketide synthase D [Nocardia kruczakiae]
MTPTATNPSALPEGGDSSEALRGAIAALRTARGALAQRSEPVAVIGAGCRLPGGVDSLDGFAEFLRAGGDGVVDIPPDRWDVEHYYDADADAPGRSFIAKMGALTDIGDFDAAFFGISPREAEAMDPQQRLLLEVTWEALEHAAVAPETLRESRTGVFVGMCPNDYGAAATDPAAIDIYSATGLAPSVAAGRIAYHLGLQGPALVVDTACSSALVALHLAVQSLRSGECDLALVAGVNLIVSPQSMISMSKLRAPSPSNRCAPFSAAADGLVRGEGCGVVVLKRESAAHAAGDRVLASIVATAVDQDGRSNGLTAPNGRAQEQVLRDALREAKVDAGRIDYIEAHGTGTPLGDPIELRALSAVFGTERDRPLLVGSAKGNLGHLEPAAGIAGLLKAITVVRDRIVPPTLHFDAPNPLIDWDATPIVIPADAQEIPGTEPVYAGVSAFGFSGTNAHTIITAAPGTEMVPEEAAEPARELLVLPLSAATGQALRETALRLRDELAAGTPARDLCFTASRRAALDHRAVVIGETAAALQRGLTAIAEDRDRAGVIRGRRGEPGALVFVFAGFGGHWPGMGAQLMADHPVFAAAVRRCAAAFEPHLGIDIAELLAAGESDGGRIDLAQPMSFAVQIGVAELLAANGFRPDAVIGHSVGEIAAARVAGALSLADAAAVIVHRNRVLRAIEGTGGMLSVPMSVGELDAWLERIEGEFDLAAVNGPAQVVVSGTVADLDRLEKALAAAGYDPRRVKIESAAHSRQLDPHLDAFVERIAGITAIPGGRAAFLSTVESDYVPTGALTADYWARNLRSTVRLDETVERVLAEGQATFVEIGPNPVLVDGIRARIDASNDRGAVAGSLKRNGYARRDILELIARLYVHGLPVDWAAAGVRGRIVDLPSYPWQHKRFWARSDWDVAAEQHGGQAVVESSVSGERLLQQVVDPARSPWLLDHAVGDTPVAAGAWLVNLAAAARLQHGFGPGCHFADIRFERVLTLPDSGRRVQVVLRDNEFRISARSAESSGAATVWTEHARGRIVAGEHLPEAPGLSTAQRRCLTALDPRDLYAAYTRNGTRYGPAFRTVTELSVGDGEALGRVSAVTGARDPEQGVTAAAVLDGCFQVVGALAGDELFLPSAIGALSVADYIPPQVHAHVRRYSREGRLQTADLDIYADDGSLVATVRELTATRVDGADTPEAAVLAVDWQQRPRTTGRLSGRWVVVGGDAEDDAPLGSATLIRELVAAGAETATAAAAPSADESGPEAATFDEPADHILYLAGTEDGATAFADLATLLGLARTLVQMTSAPRLWVVTRGGQAVAQECVDPWQASLWGFGTALAAEHPELRTTLIDLAADAGVDGDDAADLVAELADGSERHIALRAGMRWVARLDRVRLNPDPPVVAAGTRGFGVDIDEPGRLQTLTLRGRGLPRPGPREVVIAVAAAGLNFADVMWAMGFFSDLDDVPLGSECAGTVVAVGAEVDTVRVGDRVVAVALNSLATHAVADAALVHRLPETFPLIDAAALPTAYTTACYALEHLARVRPGMRILIHSGTGGTGSAAIAVARRHGLEIIATAGTEDKRRYLRELGIEHVFDSRSTEFEQQVLDVTAGAGVDIVLNSLTGAAAEASLRTVAADGIFLELGKRDIYGSGRLPLEHFKRRITYTAVDMAGLHRERPAVFAELLHHTLDRVVSGELTPLPVQTYPIAAAPEVFRLMSTGAHTGKLVLVTDDAATTDIVRGAAQGLAEPGCVLITGGLGGLGLDLARTLVERGGAQVGLLARREPNAEERAIIDELNAGGERVWVERADVADAAEVGAAVARLRSRVGPVRGVFHLAAVLRDAVLTNQSWAQFDPVLRPKALGAWNVHRAVAGDPVEYFVMYSSTATVLPSGGQLNYAAANAFLDGLAHYRRAQGRAATAVAWGPFRDTGLAARSTATEEYLAGRGIRSLTPAAGYTLLETLLDDGRPRAAIIGLDADAWLGAHPFARAVPLYEPLRAMGSGATSALAEELRRLPAEEREAALWELLLSRTAAVLRIGTDEIDPATPFLELGMSSLALLEFKNGLSAALGIDLPGAVHWEHPTVRAMHRYLCARLREEESR